MFRIDIGQHSWGVEGTGRSLHPTHLGQWVERRLAARLLLVTEFQPRRTKPRGDLQPLWPALGGITVDGVMVTDHPFRTFRTTSMVK